MVVLTVIFVVLGSMLGGTNGAVIAFRVAFAMNLATYWFSDRMVLAMLFTPKRSRRQRRPSFTASWRHSHSGTPSPCRRYS